ncbi:MAG: hypothetical protein ACRESY_10005 [Steroidobacteraceae bacterium]
MSAAALSCVAAAALLAGCGHASNRTAAAGLQTGAKAAHKGADIIDPNMVTAVNSAHSNTPISMKFRLSTRPVVGTPVQVEIALIPSADASINRIHASFQPGDGLQLPGDHNIDVDDPAAGAVIEQEVSVVPQQTGVLNLNATVMVDTDGGSLARSYSIPLVVSDSTSPAHSP